MRALAEIPSYRLFLGLLAVVAAIAVARTSITGADGELTLVEFHCELSYLNRGPRETA